MLHLELDYIGLFVDLICIYITDLFMIINLCLLVDFLDYNVGREKGIIKWDSNSRSCLKKIILTPTEVKSKFKLTCRSYKSVKEFIS